MSNDLDDLMHRIDEINAKAPSELTPSDIDSVIKYHRSLRAKKAAGEKPTRAKKTSSVSLDTILSVMPVTKPTAEPIKRRF